MISQLDNYRLLVRVGTFHTIEQPMLACDPPGPPMMVLLIPDKRTKTAGGIAASLKRITKTVQPDVGKLSQ